MNHGSRMGKSIAVAFALLISLITACNGGDESRTNDVKKSKDSANKSMAVKPVASDSSIRGTIADAKTILSRKEVPILCYHHMRVQANGKLTDYSVEPDRFIAEMKMLADSGYKTVLPDQLYDYLTKGTSLPEKPVMITFDDTDEEQFTIGKREMDKYGFKAVFFIMTISLNKPRYMTDAQLKQLVDEGHVVGAHTWDHHMVTKYEPKDWEIQIDKQRQKLEGITGKPIEYFAYPFGLWNENAVAEIKQRNFKMAFQLGTHRDTTEPLYTVRRIIADGHWSPQGMIKSMKASFR
jgi:peptidoglycan/xylan/chitin deacetylase (PgdA/CDA1 family)